MKTHFYLCALFFALSGFIFSQQELVKPITDKAVIGFPGVTQQQLENIKTELLENPQILHAYFVFGDHNCLMLKLDVDGDAKTFYDVLKPLNEIYPATSKCYIKPYEIYDFIVLKAVNTPIFQIKP